MRRKAALCVAAGSLLLSGLPASAANDLSGPPAVTRTVVVSGSATGYVSVRLDRDAVLGDPFFDKHRHSVTVRGGGPAAGFALIEDGLDGQVIAGGHAGASGDIVAKIGESVVSLDPDGKRTSTGYVVPAGSYRLYLVTGGKPTTVTLQLDGLKTGTTRVAPAVRTTSTADGGKMIATAPGPIGASYSRGSGARLATPMIHFSFNRYDTDAHTESVVRNCFYGSKPSGPQAYGPACASVGNDGSVKVAEFQSQFVISDEYVGKNTYYGYSAALLTSSAGDEVRDFGAGASVTSPASLITKTDYSHFWLALNKG